MEPVLATSILEPKNPLAIPVDVAWRQLTYRRVAGCKDFNTDHRLQWGEIK